MVLTDLIWSLGPHIEVVGSDTSRWYHYTLDLIERLRIRYGRSLSIYYPEASDVEDWVSTYGINGFRSGANRRHGCCSVPNIELERSDSRECGLPPRRGRPAPEAR